MKKILNTLTDIGMIIAMLLYGLFMLPYLLWGEWRITPKADRFPNSRLKRLREAS